MRRSGPAVAVLLLCLLAFAGGDASRYLRSSGNFGAGSGHRAGMDRDIRLAANGAPAAGAGLHSMVFLLDTSGSMIGGAAPGAKMISAIKAITNYLEDPPARAEEWALLSFSEHNVYVRQDFTRESRRILANLPAIAPEGDTPLVYAVTQALIYLYLNANGATGQIVVLSDGGESCPERTKSGGPQAVARLNRALRNLKLSAVPEVGAPRLAAWQPAHRLPQVARDANGPAGATPRIDFAQPAGATPPVAFAANGPATAPRALGQPGDTTEAAIDRLERTIPTRPVSVSVVGFDVDAAAQQELQSIALAGGGAYVPAAQAEQLSGALRQAADSTVQAGAGLGILVQTLASGQVQVLWVELNSPAGTQIQPGDLLLVADGTRLASAQQLAALLAARRAGDTVAFTIQRGGGQISVPVRLAPPLPSDQRTRIVAGQFRGESFSGTFTAYLDPNRRFSSGQLQGGGMGALQATFAGTWDPATGAVNLPFTGTVRSLLTVTIRGVIAGRVDRAGNGSGSFEGTGPLGVERGTWACAPVAAGLVGTL